MLVNGIAGGILGKSTTEDLDILGVGPQSTPETSQMNDHNVNFLNLDTKVDPVVPNVIDKNKEAFEGMGKLKNFQLKLHIDDIATRVKQSVRRLLYHTRAQVAGELERIVKYDFSEKFEGPTT